MTARPLAAALPPDLDLGGSYVIEWDAVDPVTGATVAGVKISDTSLGVAGTFGGGDGSELAVGPFMLVPGPAA